MNVASAVQCVDAIESCHGLCPEEASDFEEVGFI